MIRFCISAFLFFLIIQASFGQLEYEKGYFVDNEGNKTECYIYNKDWNNNPSAFKYWSGVGNFAATGDLKTVKEFGIYGQSKFIRTIVLIDRSGDITSKLRQGYSPVWTQDTLFLKVLVEGHASLYYYSQGSVKKFFYSIDDSAIKQLVYKRFLLPDVTSLTDQADQDVYMGRNKPNIGINRDYIKQLWLEIRCPENMPVKNVEYDASDLGNYFSEYNRCMGEEFSEFITNSGKLTFHLKFVAGINISSLSVHNSNYVNTVYSSRNVTFSTKPTYSASIASELVLPFNKNKWALLFEPTIQRYYDEKIIQGSTFTSETAAISYNSIEFPVGVKYYCYLEQGLRLSLAGLMIPSQSLNFDSYLTFGDDDALDINTATNFSIGVGADYKRISAQLRYYTNRHLMLDYSFWRTNYQKFSLLLGYRIL